MTSLKIHRNGTSNESNQILIFLVSTSPKLTHQKFFEKKMSDDKETHLPMKGCGENEEQINAALSEWHKVKSVDDQIKLTRRFLNGKLYATPIHFGPLYPDSRALKKGLLGLLDHRVFSIDGQGAISDMKMVYPTLQRAYVQLVMPRVLVSWFLTQTMKTKTLVSLIEERDLFAANRILDNPLVLTYDGDKKGQLRPYSAYGWRVQKWDTSKVQPTPDNSEVLEFFPTMSEWAQQHYVVVKVMDLRWGPNTLIDRINAILSHMPTTIRKILP